MVRMLKGLRGFPLIFCVSRFAGSLPVTQRFLEPRAASLGGVRMAAAAASSDPGGKVVFITNKMCPFAQRTWICLEEYGMDYDMKEISLYGAGGKPGWFMKMNPRGEVPVIELNGEVVADSELTLDAIEQAAGGESHLAPEVVSLRRQINQELKPIGKRAVLQGDRGKLPELLRKMEE